MAKEHIEISTPQELSTHLSEFHQEFEDLKGQVSTLESEKDEIAQFKEKMKNVSLAAKGNLLKGNKESSWTPEKAKGFGTFLHKVYKEGAFAEEIDPEVEKGLSSGGLSEKAALGTPLQSSTSTGSIAVPYGYLEEVLRIAEDASELMPKVRKINMEHRATKVPKKLTGVSFTYMSTENEDIAEANPTFSEETITAATYALYIPVSEEWMEDSMINIGQYFGELIGEAWAATFDGQLLAGSGSPVTGVLSDSDVNVARMGNPTFEGIELADIKALVQALDTKSKRKGAYFMMHVTALDIVASLKNAMGDPIFREGVERRPSTLWGYPFLFSDELPDSGDSAVDTAWIAFGNPRHLAWGDRISMEVKYYDATQYAAKNCEGFFRARVRAGLNVVHPAAFSILKTATE